MSNICQGTYWVVWEQFVGNLFETLRKTDIAGITKEAMGSLGLTQFM